MKRAIFVLFVALLGPFAAACGTSDMNNVADTTEAASVAAETETSANVGQPVTISGNQDGSQVQVTAMKVVDTEPTDEFSTVDRGRRLVAVQFQLLNTGTAPYDDAPSNGAKIIDAEGQQYEADPFFSDISAGQMLPSNVKLAPNNKALGYLTFQVPADAQTAQVQFSMDSGFGEAAQWNVQ